jgi:predicted AlkP superfamily pyrophosphatase or phosphodiesterase
MHDLTSFVPALCLSLGVEIPRLALKTSYLGENPPKARKALIYCPDAFGHHALVHRPDLYERLKNSSSQEVSLQAVFPPITPVCFASLFSGAAPAEHGIRHYEKPVLQCDTLFDALIRARKKVALIAVNNSSIDKIFRDRDMDYFSLPYDPLVTAEALRLIHSKNPAENYDVIIVYHQEYDDLLHATEPFSELAKKALEHHVETWESLLRACAEVWKNDYLVAFTPDHGAHLDLATGQGDHGEDRTEDMELRHFLFFK